ncbi:hypothetical protein [Catellatospora tritici]|uniref:hypothetical protein n=1 Tax=Catellatospora tritici TaxID=2851566 RepID=UPI001C2D38FF|nr:hypothetical protein [Catellatospora tritici]MBV1854268.1 hypothetical protein [Catellatospora tritici]
MIRQSMRADADVPEQVEAAETWLRVNRDALTYVEEDGCGCCSQVWRMEGPAEVLATIPSILSGFWDPDWDTE